MKLFLSWSGERAHKVAGILHGWLPTVAPQCTPWMSAKDIPAGSHWSNELTVALERAELAAIVLTHETCSSPWLLFEAGALSLSTRQAVVPLLLDVKAEDIPGPLSRYQGCSIDRVGMARLVRKLGGDSSGQSSLAHFEAQWLKIQPEMVKLRGFFAAGETPRLTPAEFDMLRRLSLGERPSQISTEKDLHMSTIRTTIASLRSKLDVPSITALVERTKLTPELAIRIWGKKAIE